MGGRVGGLGSGGALCFVPVSALSPRQIAALNAVRANAAACGRAPLSNFGPLEALFWGRARVALHFHPDRPLENGETVAEGLLRSGRYSSQFETRISNGSRSAFPGGQRDLWEARLFAGAYNDAPPQERPKYGAVSVMGFGDGPSPRFGSCFLVLRPNVSERTNVHLGRQSSRSHFGRNKRSLRGDFLQLDLAARSKW